MGGDFAIENLADNFSACLKTDKQRWLVSDAKEVGDIPIAKVDKLIVLNWKYGFCKLFSLRHAEPTPFVVLMTSASAT